jgi:hypothetical protein
MVVQGYRASTTGRLSPSSELHFGGEPESFQFSIVAGFTLLSSIAVGKKASHKLTDSSPDKRFNRRSGFTLMASRPTRVEWRDEVLGWDKRKLRARTGSVCVRASHLAMRPAPTRRPCAARSVGGGSVMPTPRMNSGIRACCRLVMRAGRHRSDQYPGGTTDMPIVAMRLSPD